MPLRTRMSGWAWAWTWLLRWFRNRFWSRLLRWFWSWLLMLILALVSFTIAVRPWRPCQEIIGIMVPITLNGAVADPKLMEHDRISLRAIVDTLAARPRHRRTIRVVIEHRRGNRSI